MGVIDFYNGKKVLLTGTTGFLGKVMLEKFLRVIPNVGVIYVMIRKKKGLKTMERFKKEVLGSKCFDNVRKLNSNFDEFVNAKIRPVEGDLLKDGLGLSPEDYKELTENLDVIINCAASIDFNSALTEAIDINVYGTLRMFGLAQSCKNLQSFLHVSTAYVNADKRGVIEEKVYDEHIDAEKIINDIYKMPKDELIKETPRILGEFPNTYTFTKSMVERILMKKRGDMSLTILRPSIVGAAWREPCIGWIDTVTAASAVYLLGGVGVMKYIHGDGNFISDQVPVDFTADAMIVAAATYANLKKFTIVHNTSSSRNPLVGGLSFDYVFGYWKAHPPEKRYGPCTIHIIPNERVFKMYKMTQAIPTIAYSKVANAVGSATMKKNADKLQKMMQRTSTVSDLFRHFVSREWIYLTDRVNDMMKFCTPEELNVFQLDIAQVEWKKYFRYFAWGLHHFVLGEKVEHPTGDPDRIDLLAPLQNSTYVDDIKWALKNGHPFKPRSQAQMKSVIMSSPNVKNIIQELARNRKNKNISEDKFTLQLVQKASSICNRLMSNYSMPAIKFSAWMLNIIIRNMYEKIVIDEGSLRKLAQLDTKTNGPIILMPSHRSFVDFLLVSYILFSYQMKAPHVGAYEEFLQMALLPRLMRASGAFFMRKNDSDDRDKELYDVIVAEYIQRLMLEESWLNIFLEGTRSRYGKSLPPNYKTLNMVTDAFFDKKVPDVQLVPVTLNYDRVVEADTFPFELLGEEKLKLSTGKMILSYNKLSKNFGKVFVKFSEPISLKEYTKRHAASTLDPFEKKADRAPLVNQLGQDIIRTINDTLVIMPTSIVASIMLMNRQGIIEETLIKKMQWLIPEIEKRGGKLSTKFPHIAVKTALVHLDNLLEKKKDIFHPSFSAKHDYKNIILLSYYRNMLGHIFFNEALIACSLAAFGYELAVKEGVPSDRLWESTHYLQRLIGNEWFTWKKLTKENFDELLSLMIQRETFNVENNKIRVAKKGEELMSYLCSLLWPFIESYWITAVFLFALNNRDHNTPYEKFSMEVQGFGESMYDEKTLHFYEACSLDTINNALNVFKEWNLIDTEVKYDEYTKGDVKYIILKATEDQLKEVVENIQKFMKHSQINKMDAPIDIARRIRVADNSFIPKL